MEWVRGAELGRGSFATISLAIPTNGTDQFPPLMAVKSSEIPHSAWLKNEKRVLEEIGTCPHIITCFGDSDTTEKDGQKYYNLLLEYTGGGSLADNVKNRGGRLLESDSRSYTTAILHGLMHIHANGFVHCDVKLANVLVFDNGEAKIADFGLAKKAGRNRAETEQKYEWRGTPLYMSPESVTDNEYESPCDIWALGCAVVEMVTGKPAWNVQPDSNVYALMMRIGVGDEKPDMPEDLSDEGKDFLRQCFVKDPSKRWTAEMLLNHPFVAGETVALKQTEPETVSPRGPFDFPEFVSQPSCSGNPWDDMFFSSSEETSPLDFGSAMSRLRQLVTENAPDWPVSDSWVTVR